MKQVEIKQQYNKENIGSYLYQRLPSYHRVQDEKNNFILERFLTDVLNASFKENAKALDEALALVQASKCPEEHLYNLAVSLGADWINAVHPRYQRTIILMLIKLYKIKGTVDVIRFIASQLSGFKAEVIEGEIPDEYFKPGDEKLRLLTIRLQAPELNDPVLTQQHESTISYVIGQFVPVHTKYILVVTYYYDEIYYKRIKEKETNKVKQVLEKVFSVPREEVDFTEVIKYLYDEESNFQMLSMPEIGGLLTNPNYKLLENFYTTLTRYDILSYTTINTLDEFSKVFSKVPEVINKTTFNTIDYSKTKDDFIEDNLKHKLNTLNSYEYSLPQKGKETYTSTLKSVIKHKEEISDINTKEFKETNNITNIVDIDTNLDIKYNKSERVMIKCKIEEEKVNDLGIDTRVMCTNTSKSLITTKEGRLTFPSYIDKITQKGEVTIIYY